MAYKLHTYPTQVWARPILVVAKYGDIEVNPTPGFDFGKLPESYSCIHPLNKCPALETPSGESVFESSAITKYLASIRPETGLLGSGPSGSVNAALIDSWLSLAATGFPGCAGDTVYPFLLPSMFKFDLAKFNASVEKLKAILAGLDKYLLTRTFLVGQTLTVADITIAGCLSSFFEHCIGEDIRSNYPNVMRHYNTVANQPKFVAALGAPKFCAQTKTSGPAAEAAPAAAPAEAAAAKPASKPKHPLDLLPKTSMPLDELKRQYSNSDTRSEFIPWFFKNYDPTGYVIYHCTYKYSNEIERTFMAANLITGWFQRLEHLRKYLFGSVHVFGKTGEGVGIAGTWIFRGSEVPPEITAEATDGELYEWRKLDVQADKTLIEDFFAWDGEFAGGNVFDGKPLPFNQGKTFK